MNLIRSIRNLIRVLADDARLTRQGAIPGWYTRTHYRGRWQRRFGGDVPLVTTTLRVNGERVKVCLTPAHLGAVLGLFVDAEYDLRVALPEFKPTRILDLGANAGMGTAYLHAMYKNATFVCVEPDPRNLPLLYRTLSANNVTATVIPAAIGPVAGELFLRFGDDPTCSALETSTMHDLQNKVPVPVATVPDLMTSVGWTQIDLVKMDIEGSEKELLSHNCDWLSRVTAMVLEIHPNTSPDEIGEFIRPYGFSLTLTVLDGREPVYVARRIND